MKRLSLFLLVAALGFSRDFVTGQAARAVIGQVNFTAQIAGASNTLVGGVSGLAYANGTLIVADSNHVGASPQNNRVLLFQNLNSTLPDPTAQLVETTTCPICGGIAGAVLGQPDFTTSDIALTQTGMRTPTAVATDGRVLAVADTDNNRVLIWNSMPVYNGQPPDVVVGQPDFVSAGVSSTTANAKFLRGPQGVWIQNGKLFVADTGHDRVLIWNSIPAANGQAADMVLGQPNLTAYSPTNGSTTPAVTAQSMFSPVSVTSDGQRLYVTDLGNNRVLIWNSIPTANGQAADVAIGQPDMVSGAPDNVGTSSPLCVTNASTVSITLATNANPVVFTAINHGLISGQNITISGATGGWSSVNGTWPVTVIDANTFSIPIDSTNFGSLSGTLVFTAYPAMCASTLSFPRFALSDGVRLYIADGGNDRVLVYNSIPTVTGTLADVVLGQTSFTADTVTDNVNTFEPGDLSVVANSDTMRTPMSLAWDGTNLFVSDPFDRRVMVFTPGDFTTASGVRNAASVDVFATGTVELGGTITANDTLTLTINSVNYTYTVTSTDTLATITTALAKQINNANSGAGDAYVLATSETITNGQAVTIDITAATNANPVAFTAADHGLVTGQSVSISGATDNWTPVNGTFFVTVIDANTFSIPVDSSNFGALSGTLTAAAFLTVDEVLLTSRVPGVAGNNTTLVTTVSTNATETLTVSGGTLENGGNAAAIAPGTVVSIFGTNLADQTASAPDSQNVPTDLGGVELYFDGIRSPLMLVSPTQINSQVPWEVLDRSSLSAYIRVQRADGTIQFSNAFGVPIVPQNPGIYTQQGGAYPLPGIVLHASSNATGSILVTGATATGDIATVTIEDRVYNFTVPGTTITAATNANPIVFTAANHGLTNNESVNITGATGNWTPIDGTFYVTVIDANTFSIPLDSTAFGPLTGTVAVTAATLDNIRDGLIAAMSTDPKVNAFAGGQFDFIRLQAKVPGPLGDGIPFSGTSISAANGVASVTLSTTATALCCANVAGAQVNSANPAVAGETIVVYASGMGLVGPAAAVDAIAEGAGIPYSGPAFNTVASSVSSLAEGVTANVLFAGLVPGHVGLYQVVLELNSSMPSNPYTQLTIAQDIFVSNIVTLPIVAPQLQ
jgi:uncharacterized protein (TIGR03437 family)